MSTPRKSTRHTTAPSTPRRPCTPESNHGRSPRAPGPPGSPDHRISASSDKPTKSYLRPTVSSILHHGSSNTHQPRRSIDKPPFMPPSSVGVNSQHHKNPSSSSKGSLSLKGILTRATNAMKSGTDRNRRRSASAGLNIGKGSGNSTPVRPRSPAALPKKKEGSRNFARSNSVPKKLGVVNKHKEKDTMSICSIEDNLPEDLPDPVEITPQAPEIVIQSTAPHVEPEEPSYTEKIEDNVHEQLVIENSIVEADGNLIEENHKEGKLEEIINESPNEVDNVKVIEECREEQPEMEEEVKESPKETEDVVIDEKQEEETPEVEAMNVVEELPQETNNVAIVEEHSEKKPEEAITDQLSNEPEEIVVVNAEVETIAEENKEKPKESEVKDTTIAENYEAPKEEVETQDKVEEEKPADEPESNVEETPNTEENGTVEETPKEEETSTVEEIPKVEDSEPIATETEEKKIEELVVDVTPKVEEKPVSSMVIVEEKKEKATIKKPDAVSTRREGAISNDVIEETKSKLMEKRKNKVLALVGAFETVMQKPDEGNTRSVPWDENVYYTIASCVF